jgi:phenylpropionate dioxygenase-like ring-hydroxylating dioxygenase large terminal subunit
MQTSASNNGKTWPEGLTRVPYWVFQDEDLCRDEQKHIYEGPTWNFLCLEAEIPIPGDYKTTFVGAMPVVAVRDRDGSFRAFENRCAHRGALIALEDFGNAKDFTCVYHAWRYDLQGNLLSAAFQKGVAGKGGMPPEFNVKDHGPRKLRTTTLCGLVFATLSDATPPIEEYLGPHVVERIRRVLRKPVEILGRFTQALPNNWKLYCENVRDTYHASLLHTFFPTFGITRLTQGGGVDVSESGGHHTSTSRATLMEGQEGAYTQQQIRTQSDLRLQDPSLLETTDEFGDGIVLQMLTVFPGFVLQQINNCLAVRQVLPRGVNETALNWFYIGFADDTPQMRRMRLRQSNMIGPAGYVSMEDGAVGGFVQRGVAAAADACSLMEMGGPEAESQDNRATEASVRGFWKMYRNSMSL